MSSVPPSNLAHGGHHLPRYQTAAEDVVFGYLLADPAQKSTSALQLSRELGVKYDTAWRLKHKLMQVMLERVRQQSLAERIEMDDAYLGGERAGKRGRGSHNKIPFISAVETTQDGRPMKVHLRRVTGFRKTEIARYAQVGRTSSRRSQIRRTISIFVHSLQPPIL